jgi:hypothetical protein
LGIVPQGVSFNEFNERFDNLFREAVDQYIKSQKDGTTIPEDFAANLVRIVPSEAFFKRVIGGKGKEDFDSKDHPIYTIRGLIIDKYPTLKNFELVASLKSGNEKATIVMKKLIVDVLNTRSRIFLFAEDEIRHIIGRTKISDKIESGEFDHNLIKEFNFTYLSDLCAFVYKSTFESNQSPDAILKKIRNTTVNLLGKEKTIITEEQMNRLTENVMIVLQSWGAVIEEFSEEKIQL